MRLCRLALIAALGLSMISCSDSGSDNSRLERRLDELVKELRQSRAEAQRGAERRVALLQTISATSSLSLPNASGPVSLDSPATGGASMEASRALQQAQATMSEAMSVVPLTGDPDRDFLAQMIPHHEGAIDMSKILLQSGLRPEVRRLAQEIIAHQQGEIAIMRRWLEAVSR